MVEDESSVLDVLEQILVQAGHEVIRAGIYFVSIDGFRSSKLVMLRR